MCVKVGAASKGYPSPGLGFVLAAPERVQGGCSSTGIVVEYITRVRTSCCVSRAGIFGFGVGAGASSEVGGFHDSDCTPVVGTQTKLWCNGP